MARVKSNPEEKPINVLSLGGGKQSTYMLIAALMGKFGIKPDYAVFADTGNEPEYVYSHLKWLKEYVWEKFNFKIDIINQPKIQDLVINHIDKKSSWDPTPPFWLTKGGFLRRNVLAILKYDLYAVTSVKYAILSQLTYGLALVMTNRNVKKHPMSSTLAIIILWWQTK